MGILGFGRAKKLEDLNVKGLKKERLVQEVQQDQLVTRIRRAQGRIRRPARCSFGAGAEAMPR